MVADLLVLPVEGVHGIVVTVGAATYAASLPDRESKPRGDVPVAVRRNNPGSTDLINTSLRSQGFSSVQFGPAPSFLQSFMESTSGAKVL